MARAGMRREPDVKLQFVKFLLQCESTRTRRGADLLLARGRGSERRVVVQEVERAGAGRADGDADVEALVFEDATDGRATLLRMP